MNVGRVLFGLVCGAWLLVSPVAAFLAMMAPRLSEGGLSAGVWILMINFFTLPVACVLAPIAAMIARGKGRVRLGWGLLAAPMLWIITPAVVWSVI
jgi:hypothetical protein